MDSAEGEGSYPPELKDGSGEAEAKRERYVALFADRPGWTEDQTWGKGIGGASEAYWVYRISRRTYCLCEYPLLINSQGVISTRDLDWHIDAGRGGPEMHIESIEKMARERIVREFVENMVCPECRYDVRVIDALIQTEIDNCAAALKRLDDRGRYIRL